MSNRLFDILKLDTLPEFNEEQAAHRHPQKGFECIWLEAGSGVHVIDQCSYTLQPCHIYCVSPGREHQLLLHPGTNGFLVSFTKDFLLLQNSMTDGMEEAQILRQFTLYPEIKVQEDHAEELSDVLTILLREKERNPLLRNDIIFSYLKIFMMLIGKQIEGQGPSTMKTTNKLVNQFLTLLELNFRERWTVSSYASALFVTPNYLNNVIKSVTGSTARQHIQQRVLLEAKLEFRKKGASMKQIAYLLGFEDMGHFSKFFKNISGESFSDYKKQVEKPYQTA